MSRALALALARVTRRLAAAALPLAPLPLAGQGGTSTVSVDVGAAVVGQTGTASVLAPTLAAAWQRDAVRTTFSASTAATIAGSDRWAVQGVGAGSWFFGSSRFPRELGVSGSVLHPLGVPTALSASLLARQHVSTGDVGAWLGGSAGVATRGGAAARTAPVLSADAALWRQGARWRATVALSTMATRLDSTVAYYGYTPLTLRGRYTAVDALAGLSWLAPRLELAADVGVRRSEWSVGGRPARYAPIALATVAVPVRPSLSVVVTGGDQFADPVRGTPAVRHLALALRVRPSTRRASAPPRPAPSAAPLPDDATDSAAATATTATAPAALYVDGEGARRVVRVTAPRGATRVELRADATGWQSVDLVRRDDAWETTLAIAPGTHRVMVRIDGGAWAPPSNLPSVDDDFGSRVGLLVVP